MKMKIAIAVAMFFLLMDVARPGDLAEQYTTKEGVVVELAFRESEGFLLRTNYSKYVATIRSPEPGKVLQPKQKELLARQKAHRTLKLEVLRMAAQHYGVSLVQGMLSNPNGDDMEVKLKDIRVSGNPLSINAICGYTKLCTLDTP